MKSITSQDNATFKSALKLHTSRGRKKQGRIAIFGVREIQRAALTNVEMTQLFICRELISPETESWLEKIPSAVEQYFVPPKLFEKLAFGHRLDGLVCAANRPDTNLGDRQFGPTVVVVQAIEKPGNLGAIFRSCDGAGIDAIFVVDPLTDVFHPNTIRSSLGTVFSMPSVVGSSKEVLEYLGQNQYRVLVARLDGELQFFECDLAGKTAVVFGNEANGVTDPWLKLPGFVLPMLGIADSLNISATTAVVAYESLRQKSLNNGIDELSS